MVIDLKIYVLCAAALLAGGCATAPEPLPRSDHYSDPPYRSNPSLSEADNVVLAAKATFDDWSRPVRLKILSADRGGRGQPHPVHLTFGQRLGAASSDLVSNGLTAASPTPGFGVVGTAIMAVAQSTQSLLMLAGVGNDTPVVTPRMLTHDVSHLVFWMPGAMAKDRKEAMHKTDALLKQALQSARSAVHSPYHVTVFGSDRYSAPKYGFVGEQWGMRVGGGECGTPNIACGYEPEIGWFPVSVPAPDFIGDGRGRVWARARPLHYSSVDNSKRMARTYYPAMIGLPDLAVYRAISAHLPSWAYIYLAAGGISLGNGKDLLAEPLVLNRGRLLKFYNAKTVAP